MSNRWGAVRRLAFMGLLWFGGRGGSVHAGPAGTAAFCRYSKTPGAQSQFLSSADNQLAFVNQGGLGNGGVCWWHSRFTRNAAYLGVFLPGRPRPKDYREVRTLLRKLRYGSDIVEIPGYRNLREFSSDWADEIQRLLEGWQAWDGFFNQKWISGLSGRSRQSPERMSRDMDALFAEFSATRDALYLRVQIPGIVSHAWLLVDMLRKADGYTLKIVDSNEPGRVLTQRYRRGDTTFDYWRGAAYPYVGQKLELRGLKREIARYCL